MYYIVTQMFFDNKYYFKFVEDCREIGIDVPIIPGIKPLTRKSQLASLPRVFYINLPDHLVDEVDKASTRDAIKEAGLEWCAAQCKELIDFGVPCIHYYTMGDSLSIKKIISKIL